MKKRIRELDPHGRTMSLLWASPALIFALFPIVIAFQAGITTLWGGGLASLTLLMTVSYISVWVVNSTPAQRIDGRFILSHGLLLLTTCVLVAWSFAMGNKGVILNMVAYSFAAWIIQSPRRYTVAGVGVGLAAYAAFQWFYAPEAGFPFGVFMSTVMTALSRISIDADLRQQARQERMLAIAQEQERLRIGADLHDILGHSLTAIVMKAQLADRLLAAQQAEAARAQVADLLELSRSSLAEVRAVVANMRSLNLDDELAHAMTLLESAGIGVVLDTQGSPPPGPSTSAFARILREAMTNILGHSKAKTVHIRLAPTTLTISNDGYDPHLSAKTRGSVTGLQGLRESMEPLGSLSWFAEGSHWTVHAELSSAGATEQEVCA